MQKAPGNTQRGNADPNTMLREKHYRKITRNPNPGTIEK